MEKRGVIPKGLQKPLSMTNYRIYFTNENLCFNITVLILRGFFLHNDPYYVLGVVNNSPKNF